MNTFEKASKKTTFIGEVSEPYSSPTVTRGLIEFRVHPLQGNLQLYQQAQLISQTGEMYHVMVRATSYKQLETPTWQLRDFLVRHELLEFGIDEQPFALQTHIGNPDGHLVKDGTRHILIGW